MARAPGYIRTDLVGSPVKTSIYQYPRKNKSGKTFYYKDYNIYISKEEYAKLQKENYKSV